jgi:3-(3-hydroxy-phenyl)propionate hydroxylase
MIDLSTTLGRILSPTGRSVARARDWFLRVVSAAPAVRRWTVEMRFKPIPHYRTGFVAPESPGTGVPGVGRMLAQPMVETSDGAYTRLDDVIGPWFAILGFECDPLAGLTDTELAAVSRFHPRVIKIVESRAGARYHQQRCVADETVVVEDVNNELRPWFQARRCSVVLVRPDRYVAAMATVDGLGPMLTLLAGQLSGGRPP